MADLGRHVLRTACEAVVGWNAGRDEPLWVSVNVAGDQLASGHLVDDVAQALRDTGCAPGLLVLELTEDVILEDLPGASATLSALKGLGVSLALDDFGTGHSALASLRELPLDVLKLDRSFVAGLDGVRGEALVEVLVGLAGTLGLALVAEGIEHGAHARRLAALRCQRGQGFHYARPLPPEEAAALLGGVAALPHPD
jgi:EAL domain-containing protein (putative c-di-GMP-specific phosphodiesterase class I)